MALVVPHVFLCWWKARPKFILIFHLSCLIKASTSSSLKDTFFSLKNLSLHIFMEMKPWPRTTHHFQLLLNTFSGGGSGGGFFLMCEDFGRMFNNSFPARTFFLFFFFFLKWRLACAHLFHSLGQDQSTVAQRAETTVTEHSLISCVWACFQIGSHTQPGQWHNQPTPTSLGQRCMCVKV